MFEWPKFLHGVSLVAAVAGCSFALTSGPAITGANAAPLRFSSPGLHETDDHIRLAKLSSKPRPEPEIPPAVSLAKERMLSAVPDQIERYFDVFMYVSKATRGTLAQKMFVFERAKRGRLVPYAEWQVSTGREAIEWDNGREVDTKTPEGIFVLDPGRFHREYFAKNWDNAPMHHAMFLDLKTHGYRTGVAIHEAVGEDKVYMLGRRDSAGCIRLSPEHAKQLFDKVQNTTHGRIPVIATDERGSTSTTGKAKRTKSGKLVLRSGYRALLVVENYDGEGEVVSSATDYGH
jgi:L,D-transpeptidase catalytic domain